MSCCDEMCMNHGCNQGRNCPARLTSYKANFDHLGEPLKQEPAPWTAADLLIVLLAVVCIVAIASGALK